MSHLGRQFGILLWKNFLLRRRHWLFTLVEIIIPTLLFASLLAIFLSDGDTYAAKEVDAESFRRYSWPAQFCDTLDSHMYNWTLVNRTFAYTHRPGSTSSSQVPDSQLIDDIMNRVRVSVDDFLQPACSKLGGFYLNWLNNVTVETDGLLSFVQFENEDAIIDESNNYQNTKDTWDGEFLGGIVFQSNFDYSDNHSIPDLNYTIRLGPDFVNTNTFYLFPVFQLPGPGLSGARYEDFVKFQNLIDLAYTEIVTGEKLLPKDLEELRDLAYMPAQEKMAYPTYLQNYSASLIGLFLTNFTVISFLFSALFVLKRIVHEKETGVKELMKLMGLPNWLLWVTWFLIAVLTSLITVAIIVLLMCVEWKSSFGAVITFSNPGIIFLFFMLYAIAVTMFMFALSTLFNSANIAVAVSVVVHLLTYIVPTTYIDEDVYVEMSNAAKVSLSLLPNAALFFGVKLLQNEENRGTGLQWGSLDTELQPGDPMSFGLVLGMLTLDAFLFAVITWYLDMVRPGKFGVAKKFYFPFQKSYWCGSSSSDRSKEDLLHELESVQQEVKDPSFFEAEPQDETAGILARQLHKEFKSLTGKGTYAVKGVNLTAYKGQITALLGHNGAGKTTTLSMLTGMFSPSSGTAFINGHSINTDMVKVRRSLGLCPQHNMIFSDLTVREHLIFFAMVKGLSQKEANYEAQKYISLLFLEPKKDSLVKNLSGGMKRKVQLGIALIGDSEVVMLDEPTSGMDPEARRAIWDLLQTIKKDRTVMLTTHFMEEADVLGDRIAIMAHGQVQTCGTPLFLKQKFGQGYTLTMSRGESCDIDKTSKVVQRAVAEAVLKSDASGELIYTLPDSRLDKFPNLFEQLEKAKEDLDILNFGLSVTTMEEVFLKVGHLSSGEGGLNQADSLHRSKSLADKPRVLDRLSGTSLWATRMWALLVKRALYTTRRYALYLCMSAVPFILILMSQLFLNDIKSATFEFPARYLDLGDYVDAVAFVHSSNDTQAKQMAEVFSDWVGSDAQLNQAGNNITQTVIEYGENDLADYRTKAILAADFGLGPIDSELFPMNVLWTTAIYNSVPIHARPIAVNAISNTLLNTLSSEARSIAVTNWPLPLQKTWRVNKVDPEEGSLSQTVFTYGLALGTGIGIMVCAFILFPVVERVTNAKQVQLMTGVSYATFWLSNILWDLLLFLILLLPMLILLYSYDPMKIFTTYEAPGAIILLLLLTGCSTILMDYFVSFFTNTSVSGFFFIFGINFVVGAILPMIEYSLRFFGDEGDGLTIAANVIKYAMSPFPIYPFASAVMTLTQVQERNLFCETGIDGDALESICEMFQLRPETLLPETSDRYAQCCDKRYVNESLAICGTEIPFGNYMLTVTPCHESVSMFTWDAQEGINIPIITITCDILLYFCLLIVVELGAIALLKIKWANYFSPADPDITPDHLLDDDVRAEQARLTRRDDSNALEVNDLVKVFGKFTAVRGLTFGVKKGECFGLLGINGAGKTTTFRMLTGDEIRTRGEGQANGYTLTEDKREYLKQIGYCPQFDSIIGCLTGREMLRLMARLRGIPKASLEQEVDKWIQFLEIDEYAEKLCGDYSGGNKRKLNVGMALVADPPIAFLDEPSTGVDPVSRRKLWNIIHAIQAHGQSIVLTSHSMEECEALCDRLGIMVNGQFLCMGGKQHLKHKFGQGFTILVKLNTKTHSREEAAELQARARERICKTFQQCTVKDEHRDYIHFHVADTSHTWHFLFSSMHTLQNELEYLEDYSVSETTLEQVFLSFAKQQNKKDDNGEEDSDRVVTRL